MTIYYSASAHGFYDADIHAQLFVEQVETDPGTGEITARLVVPDPAGPISDAVEITPEDHLELMDAQTAGKVIAADAGGHPVAVDPPPPTLANASRALTVDVQAWLDSTAAENGYDSLASCISYKDSAVTQWADDAAAAMAWRDAVWLAAIQRQQDALANPPPTFPTSQEVIAQLPQPGAFGWVTHEPGEHTA